MIDTFEKVMLVILVLIVALTLTPAVVSNIGATEGIHRGIVTAVETNSFIFTKQRAYVKTSGESTQEDKYCVQDSEVYTQLQELADTGETVTIHFSHPLIEWVWNCGHEEAIITGISR